MGKNTSDESVETRTPITEAGCVIGALADIWKLWNMQEKMDFWESIFKEMWDDKSTSGDARLDDLKKTEDLTDWYGEPFVPGFKAAIVQIEVLQAACAFAVQAMKAKKNSGVAWGYACQANHWLGILQGIISGRDMERGIGSTKFALLGADATHIAHRAMKAEAIRLYCDNNKKWPSRRQAAKLICPLIQAYGHDNHDRRLSPDRAEQTVYEWLGAHDKSMTTERESALT